MYEEKYGKVSTDRFKPYKLDANSNYVKRVVNLREKLGSTQAVAKELGDFKIKQLRNVLSQFRKDLIGDINIPGPETGAKAIKKRSIENIKISEKKAGPKTTKQNSND